MPDGTDRYQVDPGNPGAQLEERLRRIEQTLAALNARNPLNNGIFTGTLRHVDDLGNTDVTIGSTGIVINEGAIEVGGGPVRAIDLDFQEGQTLNAALTTTMQAGGVVTVTPPAWATTVVAQAFCLFQMTNSSGATQGIQYRATVNGVPASGAYTHSVGNAEVANVADVYQETLVRGVDFTTSFDMAAYMGVATGTNSANIIRTKATLYYLR